MKIRVKFIIIIGFLLCIAGCGNTEMFYAAVTVQELDLPEGVFLELPEPVAEKEAYFTVSYRNAAVEVALSDCVCEYADEDFQIYSAFLYYDEEKFPYSGTVIYMQTSTNSMQIFSAQDYCIDENNGVIYLLLNDENDTFSSVYKYFAEDISGDISISGVRVMSTTLLWDWFADTFEFAVDETSNRISDMHLRITSLEYQEGDVILGGEACGIYSGTGEKYCIDWEWNDTTKEENTVPHIFKVYDEEKDAEVFRACQEAFDLFEQGDWSVVVPQADVYYSKGNIKESAYRRMDVNGDGLPELICVRMDKEGRVFPIEYIYAYTGGMTKTVELVYDDLNDYTEYLFPGSGNNLIYDYSDHGQMDYGSYTRYQFDENWRKQPLDRLEIYYFYDADYYDEEEVARYKEYFPETYGSRGGGYYFFKGSPIFEKGSDDSLLNSWVREEITEAEFLELYYEMTGFDFFEENTDF